MTASQLRQLYLNFFKSKGHTVIPSASLIPRETDVSTLFTTAGMHPLVPYLLGEKHPGGKRVVNVQKCVRTGDIDDVGDNRHCTFFEMMGNWSFGDYFKKEAIEWSFEFLTDKKDGLGLDPKRLYATVFKGIEGIPKDEESIAIWKNVFKEKVGIDVEVAAEDEVIRGDVKIIPLGVEDNFWIAGKTGPCGGDTEMFYDTRPKEGKLAGKFSDLVDSGRLIEIWNDVFMEYEKKEDGTYVKLKQTNVDTGMGVERTLAVLNDQENVFETELFQPIFEKIGEISGRRYKDHEKEFRIIADHVKASAFIIAEGVEPLNVGRGYVLRRLIRRAILNGMQIGIEKTFLADIVGVVVEIYKETYPELAEKQEFIFETLRQEEKKSEKILSKEKGIESLRKIFNISQNGIDPENLPKGMLLRDGKIRINGDILFQIYQQYGIPIEVAQSIMHDWGIEFDEQTMFEANEAMTKHQDLSRTASKGMFKGGLQDASEETVKLHTAAHLMLAALRNVLGPHVIQKGSNITPERLRFDFTHPEKMTEEQKKKVEDLVNAAIIAKMDVVREEMTLEEARKKNAMGVFDAKYGENVSVYSIADAKGRVVSREICGGPHVKNTGELGHFKIQKEESSSAGVRRIKAILE